jgi:type II secretory ATPase GspE/PulE/Tfp pilus assembly ATPase PilB-like protein
MRPSTPSLPSGGFAEKQSAFQVSSIESSTLMIGDAPGCAYCHGSGRRGRTVIAEIIRVTPELDELIAADAPRSALRTQMRADGFQSMAAGGLAKVFAGEIALADLRRSVDLSREA